MKEKLLAPALTQVLMNPPATPTPVSGGVSGISGVSGIDQQPGTAAAPLHEPVPEETPPLSAVLWRHRQQLQMPATSARALLT